MNIITYNDISKHRFYINKNCLLDLHIDTDFFLFYNFEIVDINNINNINFDHYYFISSKKNMIKIKVNGKEYNIPNDMNISEFFLISNLNKNFKIVNSYNIELFLDDFFSNDHCYYLEFL